MDRLVRGREGSIFDGLSFTGVGCGVLIIAVLMLTGIGFFVCSFVFDRGWGVANKGISVRLKYRLLE